MASKKRTSAEEPSLYEQTNGSSVTGYLLLKSQGSNVPPAWVERYIELRKKKQKDLAKALKNGLSAYATLIEWEEAYKKECFYYGIRALFELDRAGKTQY